MLAEAVGSCIRQTWSNLEVLIVDDGSTDGTEALVLREMEGAWKRFVKYCRRTDKGGASAARNTGLSRCEGRFVQFLDSDDILYPGKIAEQVSVLERPENRSAAFCYCYGEMGPSPEREARARVRRIGYGTTDAKELVLKLCSRQVHAMQTSAPLWRRSFLAAHSPWREDIGLGDDLEYHVRLIVEADRICFIDKPLFFVREHPGSRLSADTLSAASLASLVRTRRAIFETLQKSDLWKAQIQRAFLGSMRTIYANALQLGDDERIRDLEDWLWILAAAPVRLAEFQALIQLRRLLGRHVLLVAHKLLRTLT